MSGDCKCDRLILLRSLRKKVCIYCYKEYKWPLKEGQKPLITSSRDKCNVVQHK